ncbi:hypothetical protein MKK84_24740 [Methylobacterium sp. E-065]|uniref:hypothetical protein n=1 Tax=Methylobacterium sp. E-065 TaxID=2836583 RepID=UPI001FBBC2AC|nr:hypothetical protein [Methylobacterium sp. E-065]MCJ2020597.1 hypothetical protein [Methylobacterium sp. E-065]
MSTPTTKVLMSAGNPSGFKLEELLTAIVQDLRIKNDALEGNASPTSTAIRVNNLGIIDCLALAGVRQNDTLRRLDLLGPDQGPGGTPRIGAGAGAADVPTPAIPTPATGVDPVLAAAAPAVPSPQA